LPIHTGSATPPSLRPAIGAPKGPATRFFVAVFLSLYGDWLTTVALLVILFEATHNPAAPAGYMLVRVAPRVMGPLLGGHLSDRISPRVVMVVTSTLQAFLTLSLIGSHRAGLIWAIYLTVAAAQFTGALGRPSQGSLIPSLVSERGLPRANATYALLFSTSMFVAPAIGAVLLGRFGPDPLFAIDAASFAICALLIASLPTPKPAQGGAGGESRRGVWGAGAVVLALRQPPLRMVAAANFASGLTITVTQAFLVVAAHERYGGDSAVGYLYSRVGVGGVLGGLVALRWIPPRTWTRFAVFLVITIEVVATAGFSASTALLVAVLLLAVSALGGTSMDMWGITEVQRQAPPGFMGRYNSLIFISIYSGMLVGALWALGTSGVLHWDVAIQISCAAMLVLLAAVWIWGGRTSSIPTEQQEP
jgi:predicted MFS family arabinose efflux permease